MTFFKRAEWHFADKLAALFALLLALWLAVPSALFIKPLGFSVYGDKVTFVRSLPFGPVRARWHTEIALIDRSGLECQSGAWTFSNYQKVKGNAVEYYFGSWASRCLDEGPPYCVTDTRQVLLLRVIPLYPMKTTHCVDKKGQVTVIIVPESNPIIRGVMERSE